MHQHTCESPLLEPIYTNALSRYEMVDAMEVSPKSSILSPVTLQGNVDDRFRKFPQGTKFTIRNNAFLQFVIKQIFSQSMLFSHK